MTISFALQLEPEGELIDSLSSPIEINFAPNVHAPPLSHERKAVAESVSTIAVEEGKQEDKTCRDLVMSTATTERPDEYDIFGVHIATELRFIPNQTIARAIKLKLQAYLVDRLIEASESEVYAQQLEEVRRQASIPKVRMHIWHNKID